MEGWSDGMVEWWNDGVMERFGKLEEFGKFENLELGKNNRKPRTENDPGPEPTANS